MHPGRTAAIVLDGQMIGFLGQVHPQTAKNYGIPETYVVEINLSAVEAALQPAQPFVEITKFPAVNVISPFFSRQKSLIKKFLMLSTLQEWNAKLPLNSSMFTQVKNLVLNEINGL